MRVARDTVLIVAGLAMLVVAKITGAKVIADPLPAENEAIAYVAIGGAFITACLLAGAAGWRLCKRAAARAEPAGDVLELDLSSNTEARVIALAAAEQLADDRPHLTRMLRDRVQRASHGHRAGAR